MKILFFITGSLITLFSFIFSPDEPKEPKLVLSDYPFPVKYMKMTIQKEKLKMAYMDIMPENGNGHTIVLLHGKNFNSAYWNNTASVLFKYGYRVIMPDQVGFGKSTKPEHMQYSFQLLAQNTRLLLDTLRIEKAIILGNSMGGMLAMRFTLMYPGSVEKLILEDPIGLEDWKMKVPYQTVDQWYAKELKSNYESIKKYQMENYYHGEWTPEYDQWAVMQAAATKSPAYAKTAWNSALQYDMIFTQPVCYEFKNIKVPTLLIIGKLDKTAIGKELVSDDVKKELGNYPALGREAAHKIPKCKLVELDGVGHVPHVEAYNEFMAAVLPFIRVKS